jgi:hypothetical protein
MPLMIGTSRPGGRVNELVDDDVARRMRRRHRLADRNVRREDGLETMPGRCRQHPLPPIVDERIERDQEAPDQDARCHHCAGRDFLLQHQIGTGREGDDLDGIAQAAGNGRHRLAPAPARFICAEGLQLQGTPTGRQGRQHAHCLDCLGMSQRSANLGHRLDIRLIRLLGELACQNVRNQSAAEKQSGGNGSDEAKERMQKEKGAEENWRPRRIEGCRDCRRGQKASQFRDVPKRLRRARQALVDRGLNGGRQDGHVQSAHKRTSHGLERKGADEFQNTEHDQGAYGQDDEHSQRVHALTVKHPVMNLQHEQRHRQL